MLIRSDLPSVRGSRPLAGSRRLAHAFAVRTIALSALLLLSAASAHAQAGVNDRFYASADAAELAALPPGTVLKTRQRSARIFGAQVPIRVVQVLHRSEDIRRRPVANVTSVLLPPGRSNGRVIAYQSFYDSRNPADGPSRALWGGNTLGGVIANAEHGVLLPLLMRGYTLVLADTEGQDAHFLAGPEYGMHTLNSLRAATATPAARIAPAAPIAMFGYSGGSIATEYATELAPTYAPDINGRIVGSTAGGLLVHLARSLDYMNGSLIWASGIPLAISGMQESFGVDFTPYLNAFGRKLVKEATNATIIQALARYPGLTWQAIARPQYANVRSVPPFIASVNQLIMGTYGTPTVPMYVLQAAGGEGEGTAGNRPGIGKGDGIMRLSDVESLLRQYCDAGVTVHYELAPRDSHLGAMFRWFPRAIRWMEGRFAGEVAPNSCATVPNAPRLGREALVAPGR